jgi:FtsP/CotA-like multicopper oxidase with cupredoxin domain
MPNPSVRIVSAALLLWLISAPCQPAAARETLPPPAVTSELGLSQEADLNPDPHVVEVNLTAKVSSVEIAPGRRVDAWTYGGTLPGPLIRAKVGDRLIVHFSNALPQPTTVHWHGIRVPIEMDGVPGVSQEPVPPGGTFTYDFVLPDAGLYWYHPHAMSAAQVGFGLYGALLVDDPVPAVEVEHERVLVLSDIALQGDDSLEPPDSGGDAANLFGREGQVVLLNGLQNPSLTVRAGALERWRIVNTAKSRYFHLILDGQPFTIIGADGGTIESPVRKDQLVLAPGERIDALVAPTGAPGGQLVLRAVPYDRGYGSTEYRAVEDLLTLTFDDRPVLPAPAMPAVTRTIAPLSAAGATAVNLELTIGSGDGKSEFRVNGAPSWKAKPIVARAGETQLWTITNHAKWAHPIHLHGFFFQVADEQGQPLHPLAWKDTVDVPIDATVRFLVKYDDRAGAWMFHCHILDHAEIGLMNFLQLGDAKVPTHTGHH